MLRGLVAEHIVVVTSCNVVADHPYGEIQKRMIHYSYSDGIRISAQYETLLSYVLARTECFSVIYTV